MQLKKTKNSNDREDANKMAFERQYESNRLPSESSSSRPRLDLEIQAKASQLLNQKEQVKHVDTKGKQQSTFLIDVNSSESPRFSRVRDAMRDMRIYEDIQDHGYFRETFNYFLDNLLCDFSQNVDSVNDYREFIQQD